MTAPTTTTRDLFYDADEIEAFRDATYAAIEKMTRPDIRAYESIEGEVYTRLRGDYRLRQVLSWFPQAKPKITQASSLRDKAFTYLLRLYTHEGMVNREITELMRQEPELSKLVPARVG